MRFYADLHVHSKYSRATSRDADLEHLALWARRKGLAVVGTGDFTHPAWFEEIRTKLIPAEPGLFRLRPEIEREIERQLPPALAGLSEPTRFLLEVEISTIYKQGDRTRKVHHLLYAAELPTAARLRARLGEIGNLASDGRPILGLPSRHLLEITLESGPDAYLIPAHVWTPWFAALGSKSGFDSIEECYGDLAPQIFAVETGLSSDPPMNWRVSVLDRFTLVSNSDAHSPPKLGREASVFDTDLDYFALRRALETGAGFGGTVEFFPEEGKYHLDGHRACGVRLEPRETRRREGLCPACGKPLTVGVLHRVEELADRPEGSGRAATSPFRSLVPLPEILAEIHGVGAKSRAVEESAERLLARLGPELPLLESLPLEEIAAAGETVLSEALTRLRAGKVLRDSGYDGEYGVIRLFEPGELAARRVVAPLFAMSPHPLGPPLPDFHSPAPGEGEAEKSIVEREGRRRPSPARGRGDGGEGLDADQQQAVDCLEGPLLILAGPGTGKTRTLTHRIAQLVRDRGVPPEQCLAVTFSRRAAAEMAERLAALGVDKVRATTFHGLALSLLREEFPELRIADPAEQLELAAERFGLAPEKAGRLLTAIERHRRKPDPEIEEQAAAWETALAGRGWSDFSGLLTRSLALLESRPELAASWRRRFPWISIDEYQDIDALQYRLVRQLASPGASLCAIGDPDQSIYGFRGADVEFFLRFQEDYPGARVVQLTRNYRSSRTIVAAACQAILPQTLAPGRRLEAVQEGPAESVVLHAAASERAEAEFVAESIERLVGGTSLFSFDSGRHFPAGLSRELSFADFAVLYRTEAQSGPLLEALSRAGIPCQRHSHRPLLEQPGVRPLVRALETEMPGASVEALLDRAASSTTLAAAAELLRPLACRFGDDLAGFVAAVTLGEEVDARDPRAERVSLLTLHAAKGLEFPVVFLVGCEDGLLPLAGWGDDGSADRAEERRLFFVGITRARTRLHLSWARRRVSWGQERERHPSPFLGDLQESLLERDLLPHREPIPRQLRLL